MIRFFFNPKPNKASLVVIQVHICFDLCQVFDLCFDLCL